MNTKIAIADDHPAVLAGIRHVLANVPGIEVMGTARDSTELVEILSEKTCDVLVTDYVMPNGKYGDGISFLSFLRRRFPHLEIIVFTMISCGNIMPTLLKLGIHSVVNKSDDIGKLVAAITTSNTNRPTMPPPNVSYPKVSPGFQALAGSLSTREFEVFRLYVAGKSISQIANTLHRSKQTISAQKMAAMSKLGIDTDADLFLLALEAGWVDCGVSQT